MAGPNALFDKSFLQSLSVDESLWFDCFFTSNICPLFYVETLADLEKNMKSGRSAEKEVALIASKSPCIQGAPNVHHSRLCVNELFGNPVPMTGQIILAESKVTKNERGFGVYVPESPEAMAFSRWKNGQYEEIERDTAKGWRESLRATDLIGLAKASKQLFESNGKPRSIDEAWDKAFKLFESKEDKFKQIELVLRLLNLDRQLEQEILSRWSLYNNPPLNKFAPYCAYVGTVELFFRFSIAAGLISDQRASNYVDLAYLHYIPFCNLFISGDKLHRTIVPRILRANQTFHWGPDLKIGLKEINENYKRLPEDTKKLGALAFASKPPAELENNLISEIWDRHIPTWRKATSNEVKFPKENNELHSYIQSIVKGNEVSAPTKFTSDDAEGMVLRREVPIRRGSWQVINQKVANEQNGSDD